MAGLKHSLPRFPDARAPTAVELALLRRVLAKPPDLHDWIREFGGYADITPDGWRCLNEAMTKWRNR